MEEEKGCKTQVDALSYHVTNLNMQLGNFDQTNRALFNALVTARPPEPKPVPPEAAQSSLVSGFQSVVSKSAPSGYAYSMTISLFFLEITNFLILGNHWLMHQQVRGILALSKFTVRWIFLPRTSTSSLLSLVYQFYVTWPMEISDSVVLHSRLGAEARTSMVSYTHRKIWKPIWNQTKTDTQS